MENGTDSGRTNSILVQIQSLLVTMPSLQIQNHLPNVINIHLNNDLVVKVQRTETFRSYTRRQRQGLSFKS